MVSSNSDYTVFHWQMSDCCTPGCDEFLVTYPSLYRRLTNSSVLGGGQEMQFSELTPEPFCLGPLPSPTGHFSLGIREKNRVFI